MSAELAENTGGRLVPTEINGMPATPFVGVGKYGPTGTKAAPPVRSCAKYPADGIKVVPDLATALKNAGLRDGMTLSTHHHFRNGDKVGNALFDAAAALGVKELRWFPSASFPCHAPIIEHLEHHVIHHIEGSMNGPLGDYCSQGKMRGMGVLRSHGGRWQAVQDGEAVQDDDTRQEQSTESEPDNDGETTSESGEETDPKPPNDTGPDDIVEIEINAG